MTETAVRFEVLHVCHANICRSPIAQWLTERVLADRLGAEAAGFTVSSAGTHALADEALHPHAALVLREAGIDAESFRSRALTPRVLATPDLILTATRRQRAYCVTAAPAVLRRTFTLRQFARLASAVDPAALRGLAPAARARLLVESVTGVRGSLQPVGVDEDDIADPVGRQLPGFRECAGQIAAAVEAVVGGITRT